MNNQEDTQVDPERQEKAKEYARLRRRLLVVELGLGAGIVLAMLAGPSSWLKAQVLKLTQAPYAVIALYFLAFSLGYGLLSLPLSLYGSYLVPHRYGLSTQWLGGWLWDQAKGGFLSLMLGLAIVEAIYYLIGNFPRTWWALAGAFILLFNIVLANLAPVLILPLFFKLTPLEDEELTRRLESLAQRAGTNVRGVYTIDMSRRTTAANAALAGWGNTRRILLGDTLYESFAAEEIETILAHELGHHLHGDIWWGMGVQAVLILAGLHVAHRVLAWAARALGYLGPGDMAAFPLFLAVMGLFLLTTMPLSNAYSRWREARADEYALQMTRAPEAFISTLKKLADQNLAEIEPAPWVEFLLYSHPSIARRIQRAQRFQGGQR